MLELPLLYHTENDRPSACHHGQDPNYPPRFPIRILAMMMDIIRQKGVRKVMTEYKIAPYLSTITPLDPYKEYRFLCEYINHLHQKNDYCAGYNDGLQMALAIIGYKLVNPQNKGHAC